MGGQNEERSVTNLRLGFLIITFVFSFYGTWKTSKALPEILSPGVCLGGWWLTVVVSLLVRVFCVIII